MAGGANQMHSKNTIMPIDRENKDLKVLACCTGFQIVKFSIHGRYYLHENS